MSKEIPFKENQNESSFIDLLADCMFGKEATKEGEQNNEKGNFIKSWENEFKSLASIADNLLAKGETVEAGKKDPWKEIREKFGFNYVAPLIIPMNAANLCPEPDFLITEANDFRLRFNKNVAMQQRMGEGDWVRLVRRSRRMLAEGMGIEAVKENNLAILRNASEGNNVINGGYRNWKDTDNIVIWEENHPTNNNAWYLRRDWGCPQFEIKKVTSAELRLGDPNHENSSIAKIFTDKINENTRFVSISETSNGTGERIPLDVIKIIHNYIKDKKYENCHFHIDATMAYGAGPINELVKHCHSLVSSCHKWFLGPKETGILYMDPDKVENFEPLIYAYDYQITIPNELPENASRFELLGQRDDANIITLAATQAWWNTILNPQDAYARVVHLANLLKSLLRDWEIITPISAERSRGIVRVKAPRRTSNPQSLSLYQYMYAHGGIAGGEGMYQGVETFRLCPHIYNLDTDIKMAVNKMNDWRRTIA